MNRGDYLKKLALRLQLPAKSDALEAVAEEQSRGGWSHKEEESAHFVTQLRPDVSMGLFFPPFFEEDAACGEELKTETDLAAREKGLW